MQNAVTPPRRNYPLERRLHIASGLVALVCLGWIAWLWLRVYTAPPAPYPGEAIMLDQPAVASYTAAHIPPAQPGDEPVMLIPTGIEIQSAEFKGPYTIQLSGYVWQKYADTLPADLDRGVVLPEAESFTFTQVYKTHQGNEELIGWVFKATVREQFDYSAYPLDRQQLWVRLWHVDFERNAYLVPDIAGYPTLSPSSLPGLDPGLVLENWLIEQSYFSFRTVQYDTNFGIAGYQGDLPQPELYFNVSLKRNLLGVIMARLLAPLVILLQLFVIVMVIGSDNKRLEQFGVKPGAVIFTCAAFFFAVLVSQNALRDEVKSYGLVYLESVHILTYLVILAVATNSVLLVARPDLGLFRDSDNLWVEVLYWPVIMFILLAVTVYSLR